MNVHSKSAARPILFVALSSAMLCLASCQSEPAKPDVPHSQIEVIAEGTTDAGKATIEEGAASWETPLQWQVIDSFVTENGAVQTVHGHKSKRVIVPVTVMNSGGTLVTLKFLVDTGADRTVINTSKIHVDLKNAKTENAGGVGGMQKISLATVPRLSVGTQAMTNIEIAFAAMPVDEDGLLGQDFLRHFSVTIDYQHGIFRLERSAKEAKH